MFIRSKAEKKKQVCLKLISLLLLFLKTREYIIAIEPEGTERVWYDNELVTNARWNIS